MPRTSPLHSFCEPLAPAARVFFITSGVDSGSMVRQGRFEVGEAHATIYTAGYSGHPPQSFAALLRAAGVTQVIDVRSRPFSRKAGFSRGPLSQFLRSQGLEYVHLPALGAPAKMLDKKSAGLAFALLAPMYERHLDGQGPALREAEELARAQPSALMCLEKDARDCHRGILAKRLSAKGWKVIHL